MRRVVGVVPETVYRGPAAAARARATCGSRHSVREGPLQPMYP